MQSPVIPAAVSLDAAKANRFDWGQIQWLVAGALNTGAGITFGHVEIKPGHKNPRHQHPNSDEVLYLIEGELLHSLGEAVVHMRAGDAFFIPRGVPHDARNPGAATARMVVAYPTGDRQMVPLEDGGDS